MRTGRDELTRLRAENSRLVALLESHGIAWQAPAPLSKPSATLSLTTDEKVALFGRLFRGRTDVYPVRWDSKAGKSGYSPVCGNEWRPGVCEKPRIKCSDCRQRQLLPLTDQILFDHLAGRHTIGLYPLLSGDDCHLLAVDFDESDWRDDVGLVSGLERLECVSVDAPGLHITSLYKNSKRSRPVNRRW